MESDYFGDLKDSFSEEKTNTSAKKNGQACLDCLFYLLKKNRKSSIESEDNINNIDNINKLPDEIILMILKWLPKKCLVRSVLVCKRWYQIAQDETLWTTLDLSKKVLKEGALGYILPRGVQILLLQQTKIMDSVFCKDSIVLSDSYVSKLQQLHLSMAIISPVGLAALLSKCKYLKILSLKECRVNRDCCRAISENTELEELNLSHCENIDIECVMDLIKLKRLTILDMQFCSLDKKSINLIWQTLSMSTHVDMTCRGLAKKVSEYYKFKMNLMFYVRNKFGPSREISLT